VPAAVQASKQAPADSRINGRVMGKASLLRT